MSLRPVELPAGVPGRLWLASMPGRFETWNVFQSEARKCSLGLVVCLTTRSEVADLSPAYHAAVVGDALPFRWLNLPIPNFGVPEDRARFQGEVRGIAQALQRGDSVMLHCAAGMGRTGTAAACVLKALGMPDDEALRRVREAGSNPQNAVQSGVVAWFGREP